jgi:hypothetical protein
MKLHYDPDTDSLYIDSNARPGADAREITDGLVVDLRRGGATRRHRHSARLARPRPEERLCPSPLLLSQRPLG